MIKILRQFHLPHFAIAIVKFSYGLISFNQVSLFEKAQNTISQQEK